MIASIIPLLALLGLLITLTSTGLGLVQGMEQVVPAPLSVNALVDQFGVPNVVTPIVLDLRLYDTVGEVIVFTLASMGVHHLLSSETAEHDLKPADDEAAVCSEALPGDGAGSSEATQVAFLSYQSFRSRTFTPENQCTNWQCALF